jgi:outer membrane protein assembly factor BamA
VDISWGSQKILYYLGGTDSWIAPKFNDANKPAPNETYAYQSLAVNLRGYRQNAANGNNAVVINSEFRLPVFTTLMSRPINNAFLRNFQLVQFIDLGTAWDGAYNKLKRPYMSYTNLEQTVQVIFRSQGVGPFAGGYGFGLRSTLLGYFLRLDAGWPMTGFFNGKPVWYFSLGLDF